MTLGLDEGKVNGKGAADRYRSNERAAGFPDGQV
jgi:hypothetical protein